MVTPTRRKPPSNAHPERVRFDEVPEDILVLIFSQCRIDELLAFRLTSSKARNLISQRIATIAPCVARSTLPLGGLLLTAPDDPGAYTLDWLKGLIPQHLAAILVDRHRYSHEWLQPRYGIPAEDVQGEALRGRVANGWRVLRRLTKISEEVYELEARDVLGSRAPLRWKVLHPSRYEFEVFQHREGLILERRLQYIDRISTDEAKDYKLLFMLLSSAFRVSVSNLGDDHKPWIFDWSCGIDGQRLLRRGESWLSWFILHEGPQLFWDQWWRLTPEAPETKNYIRDRSLKAWIGKTRTTPEEFMRQFMPNEWKDVNEKWHSLQRDHAHKVQKAVDEKVAMSSTFAFVNPIVYFTQYADRRQQRIESSIPEPPETLSHVPFHIDFRCPEELFKRFCVIRDEKAIALAAQPSARA
jgi:hypothetical protein